MKRLLWVLWRTVVRAVARDAEPDLAGMPPGRPVWGRILRRGLTDGLLGGRNGWMVLGGVAAVVLFVRRSGDRSGQVVLRETLGPGQGLVIADGFSTAGRILPRDAGR